MSAPRRRRLSPAEWVVLVVVGLALIAVLSPALATFFGVSRVDRALNDLDAIANALEGARDGSGTWRFSRLDGDGLAGPEIGLLVTPGGAMPEVAASASGWGALAPGGALPGDVARDPWGHAYLCNARSLTRGPGRPVWILSAGRNGRIETPTSSRTLVGDDVGLLIAR